MLKDYKAKLSLTTLQCLLSTIQTGVIAVAFDRNLDSWRLGWNLQLISVIYCVGSSSALFILFCLSFICKRMSPKQLNTVQGFNPLIQYTILWVVCWWRAILVSPNLLIYSLQMIFLKKKTLMVHIQNRNVNLSQHFLRKKLIKMNRLHAEPNCTPIRKLGLSKVWGFCGKDHYDGGTRWTSHIQKWSMRFAGVICNEWSMVHEPNHNCPLFVTMITLIVSGNSNSLW